MDKSIEHYIPDHQSTALVVVDIQERLAAAMPAEVMAGVVRRTEILIAAARELSLPVILTEQYPRGLGVTVPSLQAALGSDTHPIEKLTFSCCGVEHFNAALENHAVRDVILCGIETHVCVYQTALDLLGGGRRVFLAADAVCSRSRQNHKLALKNMRQAGVVVGSSEMFLFQLLKEARGDTFKAISRLVK
jgi:nicotinamidase-related amidase